MKPRIVILSAFLTPFRSGAEACAEEVPLRLTDQFDCTIVTARMRRDLPTEHLLQGKISVKRVGFGFWFDKWLYPFLAPREAKKYHPHIIHGILETFAGEALMRCKKTVPDAKRILTLQTTNRTFRKKKIIQSPDVVTAISKYVANIALEMGRNDVSVIPNGIDYAAIRAACVKHRKVPGRILFVGRLEKMKGVDLLLKAYAQLKMDPASPSLRPPEADFGRQAKLRGAGNGTLETTLHIVGDGSQGKSLKRLARELGIADCVSFKGYLPAPEVYREYAEAEIFCGLSRSEALGNVFLEAQAAGCAIVWTHVHGIAETFPLPPHIPFAGWGIPYDSHDEQPTILEATNAMKSYVADTSLRERHARLCVEHASSFDWKPIAHTYAAIYNSITLPKV